MRDLAGRTAIVTGASGGIGPYIARALADERMSVVLAAVGRRSSRPWRSSFVLAALGRLPCPQG